MDDGMPLSESRAVNSVPSASPEARMSHRRRHLYFNETSFGHPHYERLLTCSLS